MSEQERYAFSDALRAHIPSEIVDTMAGSDKKAFMNQVKAAGKTTWWIFKQVLITVGVDSGGLTLLQETADDLFQILEQCELIENSNADDDLFEVSQKMAALQFILSSKGDSTTWDSAGELLNAFVDAIYSAGMIIQMRPSQRQPGRYLDTPKDREDVAEFLQSWVPLIDMIMDDPNFKIDDNLSNAGTTSGSGSGPSVNTTEIATNTSDIPPEPIFLEIPFYDPNDLYDSPGYFSDIAPEPLSFEIPFYDPNDLSNDLGKIPDVMPEPPAHEISFYDPNNLSDSLENFPDTVPEPLSHEISFYDPDNIPDGVSGLTEEAYDTFTD